MPSKTDVLRVKLVADGAGKVRAEMLGVDDSFKRVEKSSAILTTGIKRLGGVFGALSVAALGGAIKGSIAFADSIDKAADRAGFGAEALQELRFAADQVGVSTQQLDDGLRRFTRRIGVFANEGGGPAAKTFEALGVAIRDTNGEVRSSEAIFADVVKELESVESAAERSAIAAQLFGDDAGPQLRLLLDQGAAGIRNLRQEAQDIGAVMSDDLIDGAVEAQDSFAKMANVLKVQLSTALVNLAPLLTSAANGVVVLTGAISDFFNLTDSAKLKSYNEEIDELTEKAQRLTEKLKTGLSEIRKVAIVRELQETGARIGELTALIEDLNKEAEKEPLNDLGAGEGAAGAAELATELEKIQDRLNPLQAKAKQYAAELAVITGSNLGLEKQAELVRQLDQEFADATGGPKKFKESVAEIPKEAEKAGQAAADEFSKPFDRAAENIQRAFGDTFTDLYRNGITRFEDLSDAIRDIMARLAGEITALLIFRPSIAGGGIASGLGLFGGTASAGTTGGASAGTLGGFLAGGSASGMVSVPGLGPLSVASLQTTALAIGAGIAGNYVGGQFNNLIGLNTNKYGNYGATVGAGVGAFFGGPIGAGIGAFAGQTIGSFIGNGFGFGGNNKQKFGFTTGSQGLQTPFGNLNVTASDNLDAGAILRGLVGIDESIASLLSQEQINRVRSGLAGTSQFYSANTFDNESFDVVKTRLVRIIDAVAENTVASGLLNSIGRDPGNIDQLVGEAQRVIQLINVLKDEGGDLNQAEAALQALNEQFDDLAQSAEQLGFSVSEVESKRRQAIADLATDFNTSIRDQILAIEAPFVLTLENIERNAQDRLDNAVTLGADLVQLERLTALERSKAFEQAFGGPNSSIKRFLDSLKITGAGGLSVGAQAGNAESLFNSLLGSARSDPAARADLAALLPSFVDLKRQQLGSTSQFFEFTSFLDTTLRNLVDQDDTVSTLNDIGAAITTGDNAIVTTLQEEIGSLKDQIADLQVDLALLLNAPAA